MARTLAFLWVGLLAALWPDDFVRAAPIQAEAGIAKPAADEVIEIVRDAPIFWDRAIAETEEAARAAREGAAPAPATGNTGNPAKSTPPLREPTREEAESLRLRTGQMIEKRISLPPLPADHKNARRITATLIVEPVLIETSDPTGRKLFPGDPWTRLGAVTVLADPTFAADAASRTAPSSAAPVEIELIRFVTGYGGRATYTQDVTAYAPLLTGDATLRVYISTYAKPAWTATLTLTYTEAGVGCRRPALARGLFMAERVIAGRSKLSTRVRIPEGVDQPRLFIISTGHATDGTAGDEFISRTHVLRVDGREVARWRPWREEGGPNRPANPTSGRKLLDGRWLWSSDLDRSGWTPGSAVEPLRIPLPELTPGEHRIELEIEGIRPKDDSGEGYWRVSAALLADEPWPLSPSASPNG